MTYACDCIEIRETASRRDRKTIKRHTDQELDAAVEAARRKFGEDFWLILHAVDAYMERRRRRWQRARAEKVAGAESDIKWWFTEVAPVDLGAWDRLDFDPPRRATILSGSRPSRRRAATFKRE